tara:strand:- start:267 stop:851 length:585 start_codon:yes stop_codon:yes gene_type:complete
MSLRGMKSKKSFKQRQREKRIQKQVEKLGGPKKPPQPKTLEQAAQEELDRAYITQRFGDKMMDLAGFPPASTEDKLEAALRGRVGVYRKNVPKELRDRLKYESKSKVKKKKGGGLMTAINRVKKEQGVKGMMRGGLSGGNPSGPPRRMVADPALIKPLNPGKLIDVTEMAKGGFMDEEIEKRMMGGYMEYKEDK